ncbi:glutamate-cysteine ligase-domain-containing protein [Entophlyctis helioformis]|nr:glutamate-cysteine ligase-domain-containing protein [Entophlyctis helioformis]
MGLLSLGTPMDWDEVRPYADHVRAHGIAQFLSIWHRIKARRKDHLLWGDEVEYVVVQLDPATKQARLVLDAYRSLDALTRIEEEALAAGTVPDSSWKPEYGRYMLEGTPGGPYGATIEDMLTVEDNMRKRRALGNSFLGENQYIFTLTNFPRLGAVDEFLVPHVDPTPLHGASMSLFVPDEAITKHARFPTLTANIRRRRGSKVAINLPIFKDTHTPSPFREAIPPTLAAALTAQGKPVTFQACSVEEARRLYDQLAVVAPLMLALTAAAPVYRGFLADVDCRWNVIAGSVDDRTPTERGLAPNAAANANGTSHGKSHRISKSRYDSVSRYLSPGPNYSGGCCNGNAGTDADADAPSAGSGYYKDEYNDLDVAFDQDIYNILIDGGVDDLLAKHYAHLFIRDPLVLYRELIDQNDETSSDHFENIQSTNWQTMRFKPPPPSAPNMGWRVEFRSMEIQLTDYENAAFSIFVVLLTRTILAYNLNFYIPLSLVDENMARAQKRDAVLEQKFWFRREIIDPQAKARSCESPTPDTMKASGSRSHLARTVDANGASESSSEFGGSSRSSNSGSDHGHAASAHEPSKGQTAAVDGEAELMSIDTIMNGKGTPEFPGLLPLIHRYLDETDMSDVTRIKLKRYVTLISQKASGERMTAAAWIRSFVTQHPGYAHDSVVTDEITYDLCKAAQNLFADDLVRRFHEGAQLYDLRRPAAGAATSGGSGQGKGKGKEGVPSSVTQGAEQLR